MRCDQINSSDIVAFVKELHKCPGLDSPSTAMNYLSNLAAAFTIARPMWDFPLDQQAIKDATTVCIK